MICLKNVTLILRATYSNYNNLSKIIFGRNTEQVKESKVLQNINLQINPSEKVAFVGNNGSGKTTLLRVIAGIYCPSIGHVEVVGNTKTIIDIQMGMREEFSGLENIYSILYENGYSKNFINSNLSWVIEFSELNENIHKQVRTYSSGMKLRLSATIALLHRPDNLLLDEFFFTADKNFSEKCFKFFKENFNNKILIISTHNPEIVTRICNRRIEIENGKIISDKKV